MYWYSFKVCGFTNDFNSNLPDPMIFAPFGTMRYSIFAINLIDTHDHYLHMIYICLLLKVKAAIPLTCRTLVPKVCRLGGANSFTNFGKHSRLNHSAIALVARVHLDQSHGNA